MDPLTLLIGGILAIISTGAAADEIVYSPQRQAKRTIRRIRRTHDQALATMQATSHQYRTYVYQQTRRN